MITKDSDFIEIHKNKPIINHFLYVEWRIKTKKKKKVILYKSLAEFVNTFNKKEVIKKEIVQKEKNLSYDNLITKGLSYEITSPTGPTRSSDPFKIHDVSGYQSSIIAETCLNNNPTLVNPQYDDTISDSSIWGISARGASVYGIRRCTNCKNELPVSLLISPMFCPACGTFNNK